MHPRRAIRHKVRTLLLGETKAESRVHATRRVPYREGMDLPAIAVYTLDETVSDGSRSMAPREIEREIALVIEGVVAVGDNVDDDLDDLAEEIETVMHADPYLGFAQGQIIGGRGAFLSGTEVSVEPVGDRDVGVVFLTYDLTYQTMAPEAPDIEDDFERVRATYDIAGEVHEDNQVEDEFTVLEEAGA